MAVVRGSAQRSYDLCGLALGVRAARGGNLVIKLPRSVLVSAAAIGLLLVAMNIWFAAQNRRDYSETSFGVAAAGYKAAYELLHELGIPATRSYAQFAAIPRSTVLWLVSPNFLDPLDEHAEQDTKDLISWVRSGGTAVVLGDKT